MCGIFGFYLNRPLKVIDIEKGHAAISKLTHRGPDNLGVWHDKVKGLFLGHTRLSIQDTSSQNNQPYLDSNLSLIFNGEIYNFLEIRKDLINSGSVFRTQGDTEVFAKSWQKYGEKSLDIFDGMFSFCIFQNNSLSLGVDIFGEKPLYWYQSNEGFYFSSEPRPLVELLDLKIDLSQENVNQFLMFGYIPSPNTIYKGLNRCEPASIINISEDGRFSLRKYWSRPNQYIGKGKVLPATPGELNKIEDALNTSLSRRIISDVPLGIFLSSGVDSSLIAALLRKNYDRDFLALTVSYNIKNNDESIRAKKIANYLNLDHIIVNNFDSKEEHTLEKLHNIYNEPNTGLTAFSVDQMAKLAKPYFTVSLAGVGGDEIFYGYGKHHFLYKNRNIISNRRLLKFLKFASAFPSKYIRKLQTLNYLSSVAPEEILFALKNPPYFIDELWYEDFSELSKKYFNNLNSENFVTEVRNFDLDVNLPNMIIPSMERASMKHGIEVRSPFLSKDVLNEVSSIDYRKFVKFGQKDVLRKILSRYIPKGLFDHPKQGFIFPNSELLYNSRIDQENLNNTENAFKYVLKERKVDKRWDQLFLRYMMINFYRNK
jgi:asparagine synthase (glutamine-hydrolysing)